MGGYRPLESAVSRSPSIAGSTQTLLTQWGAGESAQAIREHMAVYHYPHVAETFLAGYGFQLDTLRARPGQILFLTPGIRCLEDPALMAVYAFITGALRALSVLHCQQVARVLACAGVSDWLATHGTVRSALAGLYGRDLRLHSARFRWLKGIDRTLWYALQTADAAKVFVEGAGIVAPARAEQQASRLGLPHPPLMTDSGRGGPAYGA